VSLSEDGVVFDIPSGAKQAFDAEVLLMGSLRIHDDVNDGLLLLLHFMTFLIDCARYEEA
jgi:hypothetical protein